MKGNHSVVTLAKGLTTDDTLGGVVKLTTPGEGQHTMLPLGEGVHTMKTLGGEGVSSAWTYPMVVVRRAGGTRNENLPSRFAMPGLEMTAVSANGPVEAEELYEDALDALYAAVRQQILVPGVGCLQGIRESHGATQSPSRYSDTWAAAGSVRLSVRDQSEKTPRNR